MEKGLHDLIRVRFRVRVRVRVRVSGRILGMEKGLDDLDPREPRTLTLTLSP